MFWKPAVAMVCFLAAAATVTPGAGHDLEFSADAGVAWLAGTSYERVYTKVDRGRLADRYHKLSELVWDLEGVQGINASATLELDHRVEFRAGVFSAFTEGSGGMVDYDWFLYDRPDFWTHISRSTVKVRNALDFDLRGTLHVTRNFPILLDAILGWRYLSYGWEDRGIDYVYSSLGDPAGNPDQGYSYEQNDTDAVRDLSGVDTRVGILYEQTFQIPYVGLGAGLRQGRLYAKAEILFSPIVAAQDKDQHLLRNLLFEGGFADGTYLAWKTSLTYGLSPHLFVSASYESQRVSEFRGDMAVSDDSGAHLGTLYNGASVEHLSQQAAVSIGVNF